MKQLMTSALAAAALSLSAPALAAEWQIDPAHTRIEFSIPHLTISMVEGQFTKYDAKIMLDDDKLKASTVSIEIDVDSVDTGVEKRDNHLKSADFFDAGKFPKMTFESTSFAKKGKGAVVKGKLTIKGVTKPVTLTVDKLSKPITDPWGLTRRGIHATTTIDRTDFGINFDTMVPDVGLMVGKKVKIDLTLEVTEKK